MQETLCCVQYRGLRRLSLCGGGSALTVVVPFTLWYGQACCNKCIASGFAHAYPSAKTPLEKHRQPSPVLEGGGYACLFFFEEQNWSVVLIRVLICRFLLAGPPNPNARGRVGVGKWLVLSVFEGGSLLGFRLKSGGPTKEAKENSC